MKHGGLCRHHPLAKHGDIASKNFHVLLQKYDLKADTEPMFIEYNTYKTHEMRPMIHGGDFGFCSPPRL